MAHTWRVHMLGPPDLVSFENCINALLLLVPFRRACILTTHCLRFARPAVNVWDRAAGLPLGGCRHTKLITVSSLRFVPPANAQEDLLCTYNTLSPYAFGTFLKGYRVRDFRLQSLGQGLCRYCSQRISMVQCDPVATIDLSQNKSRKAELTKQLMTAASDIGFFRVKGEHSCLLPVPQGLNASANNLQCLISGHGMSIDDINAAHAMSLRWAISRLALGSCCVRLHQLAAAKALSMHSVHLTDVFTDIASFPNPA